MSTYVEGTCVACGSPVEIEQHHIIPRCRKLTAADNPLVGVTVPLCVACHSMVDRGGLDNPDVIAFLLVEAQHERWPRASVITLLIALKYMASLPSLHAEVEPGSTQAPEGSVVDQPVEEER